MKCLAGRSERKDDDYLNFGRHLLLITPGISISIAAVLAFSHTHKAELRMEKFMITCSLAGKAEMSYQRLVVFHWQPHACYLMT
jgi:hypothetical protein